MRCWHDPTYEDGNSTESKVEFMSAISKLESLESAKKNRIY